MGQRKTVRVFQLIAENTIESQVLDIRESRPEVADRQRSGKTLSLRRYVSLLSSLHPANMQAFAKSGTRETKAAKKQARFEELKEIFGMA